MPSHDEREKRASLRTFETANKCQNPLPPRQNHVNRKTGPMQRLLVFAFSFFFQYRIPLFLPLPPIECVEILKAELPITLVQWISDNPIIMRSVTDTICESRVCDDDDLNISWTSCRKRSKEQRDGSENWVSSFVQLTWPVGPRSDDDSTNALGLDGLLRTTLITPNVRSPEASAIGRSLDRMYGRLRLEKVFLPRWETSCRPTRWRGPLSSSLAASLRCHGDLDQPPRAQKKPRLSHGRYFWSFYFEYGEGVLAIAEHSH